jgi:hypothetical protein
MVQRLAQFLLLQFQRPGREHALPVAVLVFDAQNDRLHVRGREDLTSVADTDDALVLAETVRQLEADANARSGLAILDLLESTLSNSVRMTERIAFETQNIRATVDLLAAAFFLEKNGEFHPLSE